MRQTEWMKGSHHIKREWLSLFKSCLEDTRWLWNHPWETNCHPFHNVGKGTAFDLFLWIGWNRCSNFSWREKIRLVPTEPLSDWGNYDSFVIWIKEMGTDSSFKENWQWLDNRGINFQKYVLPTHTTWLKLPAMVGGPPDTVFCCPLGLQTHDSCQAPSRSQFIVSWAWQVVQ